MVPRMNCHRITGVAFIENRASAKVFLNNGFVQQDEIPEWAPIPEARGGGKMGVRVFRWNLPRNRDENSEANE
jgi:RimJ/RimL family protein N-acetyltransferase